MIPTVLPALVLAVTAAAEPTHAFSVHDMLAMQRISDPRVSPDAAWSPSRCVTTDLTANRGRTDVWLARSTARSTRRLTQHEANDSQARWSVDGKSLLLPQHAYGSQQVFRLPLGGGEAQQVTRLPLDVDALEVAPDGRTLLFALRVFPARRRTDGREAGTRKPARRAGCSTSGSSCGTGTSGRTARATTSSRTGSRTGVSSTCMKAWTPTLPRGPSVAARSTP